jgi:hypothetical protein
MLPCLVILFTRLLSLVHFIGRLPQLQLARVQASEMTVITKMRQSRGDLFAKYVYDTVLLQSHWNGSSLVCNPGK